MRGQNPGRFREKLIFYRRDNLISDGSGGYQAGVTTLVPAFTASAKIEPDKTYSSYENDRLQLTTPYRVTIRYSESRMPNIDMIARWRGEDYKVLDPVMTDPYRRYVDLRIVRAN